MRFSFFLLKRRPDEFAVKHASNPRRNFAIAFVAAALILTTVTAGAFRSKKSALVGKLSVASRQQISAVQGAANRTVEALPIQLKRRGFVPMQITRRAGDYLFSINNQSGVSDIGLRLDREDGARIDEVRVKRERVHWRKTVHLNPGTYLVTVENHPEWVCRVVITQKPR